MRQIFVLLARLFALLGLLNLLFGLYLLEPILIFTAFVTLLSGIGWHSVGEMSKENDELRRQLSKLSKQEFDKTDKNS